MREHARAAGQFKAPYGGVDVGASSWAEDSWKTGAPVWGWTSYDPELDLIFYSSRTPPVQRGAKTRGQQVDQQRAGAQGPQTGRSYGPQFTPHDNWDYDATGAMVLADLSIGGKLDQRSVRCISIRTVSPTAPSIARAAASISATAFVAGELGEVSGSCDRPAWVSNPAKQTRASKGNVKDICPSLEGG